MAAITLGAAAVTWRLSPSHRPTVAPGGKHRDPGVQADAGRQAHSARPTLWVLAIGVSRYQDDREGLRYADADALAIENAFRETAGLLYGEVKTRPLTNIQATRESIRGAIEGFLHEAGPGDVVVIFMAGHGMRDSRTQEYYFLPYLATPANLATEGLSMSALNDSLTPVRERVGRVVIMLDTCHAGALDIDQAAQVSGGEGLYLLAASKPGETSTELDDKAHGAFTQALLDGLNGAADDDGNGAISVVELFDYAARRVPMLTEQQQHPYQKTEASDATFALVAAHAANAMAKPTVTLAPNKVGIGEFENMRHDVDIEDLGNMLRDAFHTQLHKVTVLQVISPKMMDETREQEGGSDYKAAAKMGVGKLLTGDYVRMGDRIRVHAYIIDTVTLTTESSAIVEDQREAFFDTRFFNVVDEKLIPEVLKGLKVPKKVVEELQRAQASNTDLDTWNMLREMEGLTGSSASATPPPSKAVGSGPVSLRDSLERAICARAYAAQVDSGTEQEVRHFLDAYRQAHEEKNVERLASLHTVFTDRQREVAKKYFAVASGLKVEFAGVSIEPHDSDDVTVSYTRQDQFSDPSGKSQHLEVQVTKILVRIDGQWKIAGDR